jgi:hypothetical protein
VLLGDIHRFELEYASRQAVEVVLKTKARTSCATRRAIGSPMPRSSMTPNSSEVLEPVGRLGAGAERRQVTAARDRTPRAA